MDCVIGSGPAGVACAKGLLGRGRKILLLDAGLSLEPERAQVVRQFAQGAPENWSAADLAGYRAGMTADVRGVPQKLVYGSDFAYRGAEEHLGVSYSGVGLRPSLAQGGLSNVWGAAMLPYLESDVADWPFKIASLAEDYAAVIGLTGLAACRDSLEQLFPLYTDQFTELRPSGQASRLLQAMEKHRDGLQQAGIYFGRSRLAVRGNAPAQNNGCRYCRLCMYGCPYGYIYNAADTLRTFQALPDFKYQASVIVTQVRETPGGVEILGYDRESRQPLSWECERVFLAAGAIATTRILLRSLEAYDQAVSLKDSQYFLLPLLLRRKARGAAQESLHALSQVFLEVFDPAAQGKAAHIQVYSDSDLSGQAIEQAFGPFRRPLSFLVRDLRERLLVAQGFLHSDHSARIAVRLKRDASTGNERLELAAERNPAAAVLVKRLVRRLFRQGRRLGAFPLPPMLKLAEPGRSFHCGGSFPMHTHPQGFQTDLLGRLPGWKRVHAVDATVLPSVPATTITFTVMANAHRIGRQSAP